MIKVKLDVISSGYCWARKDMALRNSKKETTRFYTSFGLIHHPTEGYVLFDTGYSRRFYTETKNFPNNFYAKLTRVVVEEKDELVHYLHDREIEAHEVKHIIISHLHADHIGGVRDFHESTFYGSKDAITAVKKYKGIRLLRHGIVKGLLPDDFIERTLPIENLPLKNLSFSDGLKGYDLFGDGSIVLLSLPGHAVGQFGAFVRTEKEDVLLVADAIWTPESLQENVLPKLAVRLIFDSWRKYKETFALIQKIRKEGKIRVIMTHSFRD